MKFSVMLLLASVGLLGAHCALADQATDCAKWVAASVQAQAKVDFPGQNLVAVQPDLGGWDGGYVTDADVKVVQADNASQVVAVYGVMIDETCSIIHGPDLEH